jgi:hypothetical protein
MDAEERRATRNAGGGAAPKAAPKRRPRKTATNTQAAESSDGTVIYFSFYSHGPDGFF